MLSVPVRHLQPLLTRQPQISPAIPPSSLFNLLKMSFCSLHPFPSILSSPLSHFILHWLQTEDLHYLKWNRVSFKWAAVGSGSLYYSTLVFSPFLSSLALSIIYGSFSLLSLGGASAPHTMETPFIEPSNTRRRTTQAERYLKSVAKISSFAAFRHKKIV